MKVSSGEIQDHVSNYTENDVDLKLPWLKLFVAAINKPTNPR